MKTAQIDMQQVKEIVRGYVIACEEAVNARNLGDEDLAAAWDRVIEIRNAKIVALIRVGVITWPEYFNIEREVQ